MAAVAGEAQLYLVAELLYAASWSRSWFSLPLGPGSNNVYVHKPEGMMGSSPPPDSTVEARTRSPVLRREVKIDIVEITESASVCSRFRLTTTFRSGSSQFACRFAFPGTGLRVELVCKVGVGVVAARVTVCKADHILFRGCDGDAGPSKCAGFKHAGAQLEFGLTGTHQAFALNGYKAVPTTFGYRSFSMVSGIVLFASLSLSLVMSWLPQSGGTELRLFRCAKWQGGR